MQMMLEKIKNQKDKGLLDKFYRAHSLMAEHIVCNDDIRVRFSVGPYKKNLRFLLWNLPKIWNSGYK